MTERKEKTGTKIRKLIWLGDAVKVSLLYHLATANQLVIVHFIPAMCFHTIGRKSNYNNSKDELRNSQREKDSNSHFKRFEMIVKSDKVVSRAGVQSNRIVLVDSRK